METNSSCEPMPAVRTMASIFLIANICIFWPFGCSETMQIMAWSVNVRHKIITRWPVNAKEKEKKTNTDHLITLLLQKWPMFMSVQLCVKTHKRVQVKTEPGRACSLTQVCEAVLALLGCWFQAGCLQYGTPPWLGSGTGEPAAAASSPCSSPPAGGWFAEGRSTACRIFNSHNVEFLLDDGRNLQVYYGWHS